MQEVVKPTVGVLVFKRNGSRILDLKINATSSEKDNLTFFKILITVASVVNGRLIRNQVPSMSEDVSTRDVVGRLHWAAPSHYRGPQVHTSSLIHIFMFQVSWYSKVQRVLRWWFLIKSLTWSASVKRLIGCGPQTAQRWFDCLDWQQLQSRDWLEMNKCGQHKSFSGCEKCKAGLFFCCKAVPPRSKVIVVGHACINRVPPPSLLSHTYHHLEWITIYMLFTSKALEYHVLNNYQMLSHLPKSTHPHDNHVLKLFSAYLCFLTSQNSNRWSS